MDNKYISNVISEMRPFLDENGFKAEGENTFASESKKITVEYSEPRQMFLLKFAEKDEDGFGDYEEVNAWLFDDSQTESDAQSVGIDFVNTLRKSMGVKRIRTTNGVVELPKASKKGVVDISGFSKKVLDIYPRLKDPYKAHVEKYGNFLYMNFFGEYLVDEIIACAKDNAKQRKKILDLCENTYIKGDKDTINVMIAVVAAACYKDAQAKSNILELFSQNTHLKSSIESFIPMIGSKQLKPIFIK